MKIIVDSAMPDPKPKPGESMKRGSVSAFDAAMDARLIELAATVRRRYVGVVYEQRGCAGHC